MAVRKSAAANANMSAMNRHQSKSDKKQTK